MNSVLVPLDGSPLAEQSLPYAASLARRSGARVILVPAAQAHTLLDVDAGTAQIAAMQRAEQDLEAVATRLYSEGVKAEVHVYYDHPLPAILDAAGRHKVGLIVMATHGRSGLGRMVYGSGAAGCGTG